MKKFILILAMLLSLGTVARAQTHTFPALDTNNTWTGAQTVPQINNVIYVDGTVYACTGTGVQAAIAAAIALGGARVDTHECSTITGVVSQIAVGNSSRVPVNLILPTSGSWTSTAALGAGNCMVKLFGKSSINGSGSGQGDPFVLKGDTGFSGDAVFCTFSTTDGATSVGEYFAASGLTVDLRSGATVTDSATEIRNAADDSKFDDLTTVVRSGATAPIGMWVYGSCCGTTFIRPSVQVNNNSGTGDVVVGKTGVTTQNVEFIGPSFVDPGAGKNALLVTGGSSTGGNDFFGLYTESGTGFDTTTPLWQIDTSVIGVQNIFNGHCSFNMASAANYCLDVATGSGVNEIGMRAIGNSDLNGINDHVTGMQITGDSNGNMGSYSTKKAAVTVAKLPAASANNAGQTITVTDSTAISAEGQTCVGSSSTKALAFSNGSIWKCF